MNYTAVLRPLLCSVCCCKKTLSLPCYIVPRFLFVKKFLSPTTFITYHFIHKGTNWLIQLKNPVHRYFVTSYAAGPGSIPGPVNFLVEVFPGFSLNRKTNATKFGPTSSPVSIWPSYNHPKPCIIRLQTATVSDHSCRTWPSLNNK